MIYVKTGLLTAEAAGASVTITYNISPVTLQTGQFWNGTAWTDLSGQNDGTSGFSKIGFITSDRPTTAQQSQFNEDGVPTYWYRLRVDKQTSGSVMLNILGLPFFTIADKGLGVSVATWKGRACYSFDKYPDWVHISALSAPMLLNGEDSAPIMAGDGSSSKVLAMAQFANELLVWQEEKGGRGFTTLFEGYDPSNFGRLVLSSQYGIMNSKSYAVLEGELMTGETEASIKRMAFWLSQYGICVTTGQIQNTQIISGAIANYFDPTKTEYINLAQADKMWLRYDSAYGIIRVGLVSGASATECNVFLAINCTSKGWSFDTYGQALSCLTEVISSDDKQIIQVAGGYDGFIYQSNYGDRDAGASNVAIDSFFVMEVDGAGKKLDLSNISVRTKAQTGEFTFSYAEMGNTTYSEPTFHSTVASNMGDTYRRNKFPVSRNRFQTDHYSLKFRHNTDNEAVYFLDLNLYIETRDFGQDT